MSAASSSTSLVQQLEDQFDEHGVALNASVKDAHSAIAIALHLFTLKFQPGTRCISLTDASTPLSEKALPTIPPNWSQHPDGFCFQYSLPPPRPDAPNPILLVKSIRMDRTLLVHACLKEANGEASKEVFSMEVNVDDYVNSNKLPSTTTASSSSTTTTPTASPSSSIDFSQLFKDLPGLISLYERTIMTHFSPKPEQGKSSNQQQQQQQRFNELGGPLPYPVNPYPQQPRPDNDRPPDYDPLRVYPTRPGFGPRGPFAGDIDPLSGGPSGMLMGPQNFPFGGGPGIPGGRGSGQPGMAPRFDPYGPIPGVGEPDFDEMPPPGHGGPLADLAGPRRGGFGGGGGLRRGGFGGGGGGFGGPNFGGGGGFGGGGIM